MLELAHLNKTVNGQAHIRDLSVRLEPGSMNCLLGPTNAGKTSVLRLIAGLDKPTSGKILLRGEDIGAKPIQARNVAMVYQDFVNYPSLSVYENIASPLRVRGEKQRDIDRKVKRMADLLSISDKLEMKPLALSGGQQQRTALARALVKQASIVLLDEPLANLDYKLREELREELPRLVSSIDSIVVFATSDPTEALLLGGTTATLLEGTIWQHGSSSRVYREPLNLRSAQVFSDPPLNLAEVNIGAGECEIGGIAHFTLPAHMKDLSEGRYLFGIRPQHLKLTADEQSLPVSGVVQLAEVTGSETIVHVKAGGQPWIALTRGAHPMRINEPVVIYFNPNQVMVFDSDGTTVALAKSPAEGMTHGPD